MYCNVTLTEQEFSDLHNVLCSLDCLHDARVDDLVTKAREALRGAYDQESECFDRKTKHYTRVASELGVEALWAMYEVDDLSERHPFEGATKIVYKQLSGRTVIKHVNGLTWAALYVAANAAIRDSGDSHHIFIENFSLCTDDSTVLELSTGS